MRNLTKALAALGAVAALACGGGAATSGDGDGMAGMPEGSDRLMVVYENNQYTDCTVYYEGTAGRRRLGRVTGNSRGRFEVPPSPTGFRVVAEYQGVGRVATSEIMASPGQTVTVTSSTTGNLTFTIR